MRDQCENGVLALGPEQAAERLQRADSPIAIALRSFLLAVPQKKAKAVPIFEVSYGYRQLIVGPRYRNHQFSKVLAPCATEKNCGQCQQFLTAFHHHRPLAIVLEGSCEEYTEYEQSSPSVKRQAPLRFYSKGDTIGITRLLNQFFLPEKPIRSIFGEAARRMTAGARSIFLTTSVSSPRVAECIPKSVLQMHGLDDVPTKHLGKQLDSEHSLFFRLMEDVAVKRLQCRPWRTRLVFVSVEGLSKLIADSGEATEAKALLLAVLSEYFLQSRNKRSDFLRQMVVVDRLSDRQMPGYVARTIHHLSELMRGEFPGFVPHDPTMGNDFGPFDAVYSYLREAEMITPKSMDGFPMVLRPAHLGHTQPSIYYSFERPTLLAPVGQIQSVRSFLTQVEDGLKYLADRRRGFFDSAQWRFFISKGKPHGPKLTKTDDLSEERQVRHMSYQTNPQIQEDFRLQIENAREKHWIPSGLSVFAASKWGFMGGFVRIHREMPSIYL